MRASVASLSKKLLTTFFAATLTLGLVPAAAFAVNDTDNNVDTNSGVNVANDVISSEGEESASIEQNEGEALANSQGEDEVSDDAAGGEAPAVSIPAGEIINQEMSIRVVAQAESTRSYFLAQTLESTRTVPVVSASLPLDAGVANEPVQDGEGYGESGVIAADSVVVGSFEADGIVYALEPGGESVALVAVDGSEPFEALVEDGALVLPSEASLGDEAYTVTRIAAGAFAGIADIDSVVVPASIVNVEDGAFAGFASLKSIVVSLDNPVYSSYDDCLYTADESSLLLIPEGRTGAVRIASNVTEIDPEVFSHCPSVDALVADADSAALFSWEGSLYDVSRTTLLRVPPAATDLAVFDGCVSVAEGALEGCTELQRISSPASVMSVSLDVFGAQQDDASSDAVDPAAIVAQLPPDAFRTPWEAIGVTVEGGIEGFELTSEPAEPSEETYLADQQDPDAALSSFDERTSSAAAGDTITIYCGDFGGVVSGSGLGPSNSISVANVQDWAVYGPTSAGAGSVQFHLTTNSTLYCVTASGRSGVSVKGWRISDSSGGKSVLGNNVATGHWSVAAVVIWSDFTIPITYKNMEGATPCLNMHELWAPNSQTGAKAPSKTGYTFAGWFKDSALTNEFSTIMEAGTTKVWLLITPASGSLSAWAKWTPNIYTITLNMNGGSWSNGTQFWEQYGVRFASNAACTSAYGATLGGTMTKTGHTLDGFYTAATGGTKVMNGATLPANTYFTSNTTLYAHWTPNIYTITLNMDGGSWSNGTQFWEKYGVAHCSNAACTSAYGANLGGTFTKQHYTLEGFYTAANGGGTKVMNGSTLPANTYFTGNTTLYANWKPNVYKISLDLQDGTWSSGHTAFWAKYGDRFWSTDACTSAYGALLGGTITKTGYILDGFYTAANGGGTKVMTGMTLPTSYTYFTGDTTLYANWTPKTSELTFSMNDGSGTAPTGKTATYGQTMPVYDKDAPSRTGYTFGGFYDTAANTGGDQYYKADLTSAQNWNKDVTTPTTLYARWTANKYSIEWDANGGTNGTLTEAMMEQTFGGALTMAPKPTRVGYAFDGWWTTDGSDSSDPGTKLAAGTTQVPASNATYFARWIKQEGKIILNAYDASDTAHADAKFMQDQVDAYNDVADNPAAKLLSDTQIQLTYDVNTPVFSLQDPNLLPTLLGAAFGQWNPSAGPVDPASEPTWDASSETYPQKTYTASWSTNSYGITYKYVNQNDIALTGCATADGSTLLNSFNEATTARALPAMAKRGYDWVGWTYEDEFVIEIPDVSDNMTLIGHFKAKDYPMVVDLTGGNSDGWTGESFTMTYDDPYLEMPATPKKNGYIFRYFEAHKTGSDEAVYVCGQDDSGDYTVATKVLEPGKTYKVLGLGSGADAYDVSSIKAIWQVRIVIDVSNTVKLGIMADTAANTLRFRHNETVFTGGDTADEYAPVTFISYTTAPVGIVEVADDMTDEAAQDRADLREEVFRGKQGSVALAISASKALTHKLSFGGATDPVAAGAYLNGLRIEKANAVTGDPTETVFWLGMDFGGLKAADIALGKAGDIAKLYYTVALLDDDGAPIVESLGKLSAYDGGGVNW